MYTAIVLDFDSKEFLEIQLETLGLSQLGPICHHMTLHMGPAHAHEQPLLGKTCEIEIDAIGFSDLAVAARVTKSTCLPDIPLISVNKTPHITMAVNRAIGAGPVDSNKITDWKVFAYSPIILSGVLEQCK